MDQIRFKTTEPDKDLAEALHIMHNHRLAEDEYFKNFGYRSKNKLMYWSQKRNDFLDGHRAKRVNGTKVIHD